MSAIGEWVGTIIVVVTLVYLARQVHLNTITNRVTGIASIADAARESHFTVARDRDIARVFLVGVKDSKDYPPAFKSWIDRQVAQSARSGE